MCLLTLALGAHPDFPLVVAANRDEWQDRPAAPLQLLETSHRPIVGGRDLLAAGTWLAVNDLGVVAGLTNQPLRQGPRADRRSRGMLPLIAAREASATLAVAALQREIRPTDFNPCWMLVGDRNHAFWVDLTGEQLVSQPLDAGLWVLENRPLHESSAKAAAVRAALSAALSESARTDSGTSLAAAGDALVEQLGALLRSHEVPASLVADPSARSDNWRPLETEAACVHAGPYGTRSAMVVLVGQGQPRVWSSNGPPCRAALIEDRLWPAA